MTFTREDLDAFLSKTDFDFSTVAGWEEFLAERRAGGTGRDADGIQLRDIKNYAVGTAMVISQGSPIRAWFNVRSLGSGLALAPGVLYVNYPDASDARKVQSFYIGPPGSSIDLFLQVGGAGSRASPHWDVLYYIVIKSGDLPGQGAAEALGRRALNNALRGGGWLLRRGFGLLRFGGAGYDVTVRLGTEVSRNQFLDQEILSDEAMQKLRRTAEDAWDYLTE